MAVVAALCAQVAVSQLGWAGAQLIASAAPLAEESEEDRVKRCSDPFEKVSDPKCIVVLNRAEEIGFADALQLADGLNDPANCIVTASQLGLDPAAALTACAAREAKIEELREQERRAVIDNLSDPTSPAYDGIPDLDTAVGCSAYARDVLGLSEADANIACGIRLSKIAEQKANEALEQIRTLREESERKAARKNCEEIADKVIAMTDALYTPKWDELGGDAEWNKLEAQFKELDCKAVLNLPDR